MGPADLASSGNVPFRSNTSRSATTRFAHRGKRGTMEPNPTPTVALVAAVLAGGIARIKGRSPGIVGAVSAIAILLVGGLAHLPLSAGRNYAAALATMALEVTVEGGTWGGLWGACGGWIVDLARRRGAKTVRHPAATRASQDAPATDPRSGQLR